MLEDIVKTTDLQDKIKKVLEMIKKRKGTKGFYRLLQKVLKHVRSIKRDWVQVKLNSKTLILVKAGKSLIRYLDPSRLTTVETSKVKVEVVSDFELELDKAFEEALDPRNRWKLMADLRKEFKESEEKRSWEEHLCILALECKMLDRQLANGASKIDVDRSIRRKNKRIKSAARKIKLEGGDIVEKIKAFKCNYDEDTTRLLTNLLLNELQLLPQGV